MTQFSRRGIRLKKIENIFFTYTLFKKRNEKIKGNPKIYKIFIRGLK